MSLPDHIVIRLAVAIGVGLLIGIERERSKGSGPSREVAGVRTFSLIALTGAVSILLGDVPTFICFALLVGLLVVSGYRRSRNRDPGLTSEVAQLITFLLGAFAIREPQLAAALGVVVAILLAARATLHTWVRDVLTDEEIRDGLLLAAAALVILPLTPTQAVDPWGVIKPRQLWTLAVTVMAINALGYIALRALGPKTGLALAGLFSGFVSSTATIGAMGARAKAQPGLRGGAVAGAAVSSVATVIQLAVVVGVVSVPLLRELALPLLAAGLMAAIYAGVFMIRSARDGGEPHTQPGRPFDPKTALIFVAVVGVALTISTLLTRWLGSNGLLIANAVGGFGDAHAPAISAATLAAQGSVDMRLAAFAVLAGFSTNAISKIVVASFVGDRGYALQLVPGILLSVAAAWTGMFAFGLSAT